jgi:hypothetical protein
MKIPLSWRRSAPHHQICFAFAERSRPNKRRLKWLIVTTAAFVIALILRIMPLDRYLSNLIAESADVAERRAMGKENSRAEIDKRWRKSRQLGIETTRPKVESSYALADPALQRLLEYSGMDPDHMLLRWGTYDQTLVLSSKVFEADDDGRSYRLKPQTRSVWLTNVPRYADGPMFFLVPDGPGLTDVVSGVRAQALASSKQTTNSWGLRGPEPDPGAKLRGLILGDSFMQGIYGGDSDSPPERLRRYLQDHLKTNVAILNGGVIGYSPEQYFYSLTALAARFKPHFVIVSLSVDNFGNEDDVASRGRGDWEEGRFWLEKIINYCRARQWPAMIVPVPLVTHLTTKRMSGYYPGMLTNNLEVNSLMYLDPVEDFADAYINLLNIARADGQTLPTCPLFNGAISDKRFSATGTAVWVESVGRRLILVLGGDVDRNEHKTTVIESEE